jgi:RNA polymerase sigma factor (sigma-70 family)
MVFRVCRSVLRDTHDAEDAFQAVFLVLAYRAKSIRRRGSLASWLFGVAHRVASRARTTAASRRARDARVAVRTTESYVSAEECHDDAILHEEINRLPEGLRSPVTLCYMEGLTYEVAAHRLGLSETVVRGKLARARERLRRRLTARGVTVPVGMLIAGTAGQTQAAIPTSLVHSTVRIALGFAAGKTASVLARGVLNTMLLNQLKVASVLLLLGIGGRYCAWNAFAGLIDDKGQAKPVVAKTPAKAPVLAPNSQTIAPAGPYRLTGTVKLDRTGEPVAGAKLRIHLGDVFDFQGPGQRLVESGADGLFAVDIPAGPFQVSLAEAPIGYYWVRSRPGSVGSLFAGPEKPVIHGEYRVRKGTIWDFQFTRGAERKPFPGFVAGYRWLPLSEPQGIDTGQMMQAQADDVGHGRLVLPGERRGVILYVRESSLTSGLLETGSISLQMGWEADFRPDQLREISSLDNSLRGWRLIDADGKSATLQAPASIEPVNDNGRLVIRVAMPHRDSNDFGAVTGQVLDDKGQPIPGVRVGLATTRYRVSDELRHQSTTNAEGRYRLRDIPRRMIDGEPLRFQIVVVKEGYAGFVSPQLTLKDGATDKLQVIDPIHLEPGVAVSGIVVDHRGQPVIGARVRTNKPVPYSGLSDKIPTVRTDENGHFTMHDLQRGITSLTPSDGNVFGHPKYVRVGSSQSVLLQLTEPSPRHDVSARALAAPSNPVRAGQAAPEWQVRPWSDGRNHSLGDDSGKVIVLYFWGTDFWQSVGALPALGKLVAKFEPRGVLFRSVHRPDTNDKRTVEEARRLLAHKEVPLVFALDQMRVEGHSRGATAQRYGVINYPVVILIDRAGKVAFRSDMAAYDRNVAAVFMQILTDPQAMTEEKANRLVERAIAEEIELVLEQKD